ncbi:chromate transporter [Pueribacillus sp. YX66]|uniref:chromate transporter n=1 Tax=Pueribacillus sp. YX66 TaxID=3229242 RepID=UPI00358D01FC
MTYVQLFIAFFRSGILGYGGGPAAIPLVYREVVDTYKWMNDTEFSDVLALANTLPGPINTKMAGYIGYRVAGWLGMLVAVFATVIPTVVLMVVLLVSLSSFKNIDIVEGMTKGVVPVVGVLMGVLTWGFITQSTKKLGLIAASLMIGASLLLLEFFGLHPGFLIIALLLFALLKKDKKEDSSDDPTKEKGVQSR